MSKTKTKQENMNNIKKNHQECQYLDLKKCQEYWLYYFYLVYYLYYVIFILYLFCSILIHIISIWIYKYEILWKIQAIYVSMKVKVIWNMYI